jgi:hypothetical protein
LTLVSDVNLADQGNDLLQERLSDASPDTLAKFLQ